MPAIIDPGIQWTRRSGAESRRSDLWPL